VYEYLEIRREGFGWVEDVGVPPVGEEGTVQEGLLLRVDPLHEELQSMRLAALN
jgi:hypothetical protein